MTCPRLELLGIALRRRAGPVVGKLRDAVVDGAPTLEYNSDAAIGFVVDLADRAAAFAHSKGRLHASSPIPSSRCISRARSLPALAP